MKIAQTRHAIDCFHGRVQMDKHGQHALILSVMAPGKEYTGQELFHLTGLTPNIISARLTELRKSGDLERPEDVAKVCPYSHVSVSVHRKPAVQKELFAA